MRNLKNARECILFPVVINEENNISRVRRVHSSKPAAVMQLLVCGHAGTDRQTDRQTDGQTDGRPTDVYCTDAAANTIYAGSSVLFTMRVMQPSSIRRLATPWTYFLHLSLRAVPERNYCKQSNSSKTGKCAWLSSCHPGDCTDRTEAAAVDHYFPSTRQLKTFPFQSDYGHRKTKTD